MTRRGFPFKGPRGLVGGGGEGVKGFLALLDSNYDLLTDF